ncbi:hypothetical protein HYG87_04795 [Methanobacterium alkalithermotolerans]|uniref:KEOPS complex subunit n=1 Tax=Methanobacterium alkalithermotolerans TaxID=2731220 RepID=A0A8T8K6K5_9EURY|nr:KEOPS complex subunit Pcc1 [Methanobacterium alkalithermotolerans]QUH23135.1 hypothetical protein HYG87_04795 [Methanobacterium alkalithermotolerans]RJS48366.1 MAG: hypothetical protein CIT03_08440 [Methanobacterium sp.]
MNFKADIKLEYKTKKQAQIALESLKPDNINYVNSKIQGSTLIFKLSGESIRSFLASADDLIFCEMVVEKMLNEMK